MREKEARERLKEAAAEIMKKLRENPGFERLKNQIEVQMTAEGLRIQLLESVGESFFERGSAELKPFTKQLLMVVAEEIARLPNRVIIEGHTDAYQYADGAKYTNWELSVDRCNSARRWMKENGLRQDQVAEVRGYADTQPKDKIDPGNPANRRIAIIVQNEFSGLNYLDKNVIVEDKEITQAQPPAQEPGGSEPAPTSAVESLPLQPQSASSE
jgi:chemotaxis protein MotB